MDELNQAQREAVFAPDCPILVLAGAGTGKTRTIASRIIHLMEKGVDLSSILAITFTNKAAKEMKDRVEKNLIDVHSPLSPKERQWKQPWMGFSSTMPEISTFHSFCLKMLRQESELLGYPNSFMVYDSADQLALIKKVVKLIDPNESFGNPKSYQAAINGAKTKNIAPKELGEPEDLFQEKLLEIYIGYQGALYENQAMDFGDLIMNALRIFLNHPKVLEKYQDKFHHVMVDEYQDTNKIQYDLISVLVKKRKNIFVVGDEDQSIYRWRGADIRNILDFQKDYPEALVVRLEENYRSTKNIIKAASHLISSNVDRYKKTLFTNKASGSLIQVAAVYNEVEEARYVIKKIKEFLNNNPSYSHGDVAVFYRSHVQSRILEEEFRKNKMPYKIIGGLSFYERKEIKDILAYIRVLVSPQDSFSLIRIINSPARGIGKSSVEKLENHAMKRNISLYHAIRELLPPSSDVLSTGVRSKLKKFYNLIEELRALLQTQPVDLFYESILQKSGYWEALERENTEDAQDRMENLKEFSTVLQLAYQEMFQTVEVVEPVGFFTNFLNQISLEAKILEEEDTLQTDFVSLMTLHASKGLEFSLVFMVGCEEGIFPLKRSISRNSSELSIEEERRLCYVGMTRAKLQLHMTATNRRRLYGGTQVNLPSRFIQEIPDSLKSLDAPSSFHSNSYHSHSYHVRDYEKKKSAYASSVSSSSHPNKLAMGEQYHYEYEDGDMDYDESPSFQIGSRVRHHVYGQGVVESIGGTSADRSLLIRFKNQSSKKFKLKYAKLELLS